MELYMYSCKLHFYISSRGSTATLCPNFQHVSEASLMWT